MSFQFLTVQMINKARTNNGFINQTEFKTASKYLFDTLILTDENDRLVSGTRSASFTTDM